MSSVTGYDVSTRQAAIALKKPDVTRDAFETHLRRVDFDVTIETDVTATFRLDSDAPESVGETATLPHLAIASESRERSQAELKITGTLGEGGMAIVHRAEQLALGREVAVKTPRDADGKRYAGVLLHEACVTGRLEHPHIVPVYMLGSDDAGNPQIVMKRIDGTSWEELVGDADVVADPEMLADQVGVLLKVCSALRFAHDRNIVHRDIKPANVMIGDFDEVYLLDWGLALSLDGDDPMIQSRQEGRGMSGTPSFMAPEMTHGDAVDIDERTDIYLVGATLHWLLTGEHRHQGEVLFEVLFSAWRSDRFDYGPEVPAELAAIANRACSHDKGDRFQSIDELRVALEDYLAHRESIGLSQVAHERRKLFEGLLHNEARSEDDERELHDLFGECRFGFVQALRMWSENSSAREGLQRVLEMMARHYVSEENPQAAEACLSQLPEPNHDLEGLVEELRDRIAGRGEDLERLRAMEEELDAGRGMLTRSRVALFLALIFTFATFRTAWREMTLDLAAEVVRSGHMMAGVRNVVIILLVLAVLRKRLMVNRVNRDIMRVVLGLFVVVAWARFAVWYLQAGMQYARAVDEIIFAFAAFAVGVVADVRVAWFAGYFLLSSVVGLFFPEVQIWASGVATALFFGSLAWVWRNGSA